MAIEVKNKDELIQMLAQQIGKSNCERFIIGIDGKDGAGKTRLAEELTAELPCHGLKLDAFLSQDQNGYVPHIRYDDLSDALNDTNGSVIVEGVCLRAVAEKCGFGIDLSIYVRCLSQTGIWNDEDMCRGLKVPKEQIENDRELRRQIRRLNNNISPEPEALFVELAQYHYDYRPYDLADYLFTRRE